MSTKMNNSKTISLYKYISSAVIDGHLPEDFSLLQIINDNEPGWMDGALDGVCIFHTMFSDMSDEERTLMIKAVNAASEANIEMADKLFLELGQKKRAITIIDELQSYIIENKDTLSANNLYGHAVHLVTESADTECVKFGLSLLELFDIENNKKLKNVIQTLGLSDEFSIFAIFIMLKWENGNNEVFHLAQKLHGWGRIHAVERIEPETDEIKKWLLKDGVHNTIMPAYSALVCWQKSDAESVLKSNLSREDFSGIRDIIGGLLDEGPVPGISQIENENEIITTFLNKAMSMKPDTTDCEVIQNILTHYEGDDNNSPDIVDLCKKIIELKASKPERKI